MIRNSLIYKINTNSKMKNNSKIKNKLKSIQIKIKKK